MFLNKKLGPFGETRPLLTRLHVRFGKSRGFHESETRFGWQVIRSLSEILIQSSRLGPFRTPARASGPHGTDQIPNTQAFPGIYQFREFGALVATSMADA
jgi:hypothetical protein